MTITMTVDVNKINNKLKLNNYEYYYNTYNIITSMDILYNC